MSIYVTPHPGICLSVGRKEELVNPTSVPFLKGGSPRRGVLHDCHFLLNFCRQKISAPAPPKIFKYIAQVTSYIDTSILVLASVLGFVWLMMPMSLLLISDLPQHINLLMMASWQLKVVISIIIDSIIFRHWSYFCLAWALRSNRFQFWVGTCIVRQVC